MVNEIIERARQEIATGSYNKTSLAIAAGLHQNTLRHIDRDSFAPNYKTLVALENFFSSAKAETLPESEAA
jgi:DNA-binding XRE family transcriptional regulator